MSEEKISFQVYATKVQIHQYLDSFMLPWEPSGDKEASKEIEIYVSNVERRYVFQEGQTKLNLKSNEEEYKFHQRLFFRTINEEQTIRIGSIKLGVISRDQIPIMELTITCFDPDKYSPEIKGHLIIRKLPAELVNKFELVDPTKRHEVELFIKQGLIDVPYSTGSANGVQETKANESNEPEAQPAEDLQSTSLPAPWDQTELSVLHRNALQLWHEGNTTKRIGEIIGIETDTMTNYIYLWRKKYGPKIVPYDEDRDKAKRKKSRDTS